MKTKTAMITIAGRPNVGKSTLTNYLVGEKIAIVSNKPQTTRNRICGIVTRGDTQFVFVDTPGFHRPRTKLGDFMVEVTRESIADVDLTILVVEPIAAVGPQEQGLIEQIKARKCPAILAINKIDTVEKEGLLAVIAAYSQAADFDAIIPISAKTGDGVDELLPLLHDRITLLSGNSGVGKSTLINRILPGVNLRTAEISDSHNTGMHTTTFSEMLQLPNGGYLIDTPGIKGFGTFNMEPEEISSYFKEIFRFSKDCRFNNCTHTHEPGCAVLKAVEDHYIAASRYQSYMSMLNDKDENKYREAY